MTYYSSTVQPTPFDSAVKLFFFSFLFLFLEDGGWEDECFFLQLQSLDGPQLAWEEIITYNNLFLPSWPSVISAVLTWLLVLLIGDKGYMEDKRLFVYLSLHSWQRHFLSQQSLWTQYDDAAVVLSHSSVCICHFLTRAFQYSFHNYNVPFQTWSWALSILS